MAKFNKEHIDPFLAEIEEGITQKDAASLAHFSESTYHTWKNKVVPWVEVKKGEKKIKLFELVERAEAKYIKRITNIANVKATREPTGKRALEILAVRRANEWGEKQKFEGELNVNVIIDSSFKGI